ncbi:Cyclin J [Operophtera brumata]|uniref:Cyclin J n=1 Tax=Operophtera brumata TaxID=104452 RepID=A0A0L7LRN4_OPEBR|nr:Cyclin J [Operophtera brumata]
MFDSSCIFSFQPLTDNDEYHCEYREEIWKTLLEQDAEKPTIHLQSPQLEFRGTLVQQLRDVTKKLGLSIATLHSAVAQLDLFMDAHRLRADRLAHVALACLSLAAKSEEKFSRAPTLKTLAKTSGVSLCGKTFRQLEWMVGQHVRWRLLAPTPVAFAALLAQYVGTDADLTSTHPKFRARMMQIMKSRETAPETDIDQGYGSARTSPNITPSTSPSFHVSPASSSCSTSSRTQNDTTYRQHPITNYTVLDNIPTQSFYHLPSAVDMTMQRVNNAKDYRYCKARRLIDESEAGSSSMAVKRGIDPAMELERKRYRLTSQMSQVVL